MAKKRLSNDALSIDVMKDLRKFDGFANKLLSDRRTQRRFFRNPSQVMVDLGLHPKTSRKAIATSNRMFYAALRNKKLLKYVMDYFADFKAPAEAEAAMTRSLAKGALPANLALDRAALEKVWNDQTFLRDVFTMNLADLNRRGILSRSYSTKELGGYIEKVLAHYKARAPLSKMAKLEKFGPRYGIGYGYGDAMDAEATAVSTVIAVVEGGAAITVLIPIDISLMGRTIDRHLSSAFLSDDEGLKAAATVSRVLSFASDLALFVKNLDKESYVGKPRGRDA